MIDKGEILISLDKIDFHDIPVEKISFKTENSVEFIVDFALYNEEKKDYNYLTIKFIDIIDLKTDEMIFNSESQLEIYNFDYHWIDLFIGEIIFYSGLPSFIIKIICKNIELTNTTINQ